jgi:hypothetical protein
MSRILMLCLCLGLLACSTPPAPDVASTKPAEQPGATRYVMVHGALVACTRTGFDTICR